MADDAVLLGFAEGIATVTLNRPSKLNAMSEEMTHALDRRLDELADLTGLRAVIVTAAGRAFSAGGDLGEFEQALESGRLIDVLRYNQGVLQRVEDIPVPVIGAANGIAVAGGLELLLCCDLIVAAETASLSDGHARYGIVPAGGATVRLAERVSPSHAAQLFYTADPIDARTAATWGLVNEVVPDDRLLRHALDLAGRIRANGPEAIRHIKFLTGTRARGPDRAARLDAELERFAQHVGNGELRSALADFRLKRRPSFR